MAGLFMASCYKIYFCYLWKLIFKVHLIDGFSVDGMKTGFKNNVRVVKMTCTCLKLKMT